MAGGGPFQSNNAPEAHFGLPKGSAPVKVDVRFPDGTTTTQSVDSLGRRLVVDRASAATSRPR
jgi:hypothetical protein